MDDSGSNGSFDDLILEKIAEELLRDQLPLPDTSFVERIEFRVWNSVTCRGGREVIGRLVEYPYTVYHLPWAISPWNRY